LHKTAHVQAHFVRKNAGCAAHIVLPFSEVVMVRRFVSSWRLTRTIGLIVAAVAMSAVGVVSALTNMAPPRALAPPGEPLVVVTARPAPVAATQTAVVTPAAAVTPAAVPAQPVRAAAPVEPPKKPAPAVVEPAKAPPPKVEATVATPARVEPPKIEPAKIEPVKAEPVKTDPPKLETATAEPAAGEPVAEAEPAPAPPRPKPRVNRAPRVVVAEHGVEGPAVVARTRRPAPFSIRDLPRR